MTGRHDAAGHEPGRPGVTLAELVATTAAVAATSSRSAKITALAELFRNAEPIEAGVLAQLVAGAPRQGRTGVGWSTVATLRTNPAGDSQLRVTDLDNLLDNLGAVFGSGSSARRAALLDDFVGRCSRAEVDFLCRLLAGELRQGAGAGIVVEAVARAAQAPAAALRRALMLSGDLGVTTRIAMAEGRAGLAAIGLELMRPIQPMLATTAASAAQAVAELGRASVEWKLDGVRIQAHRRADEVSIWTRKLNDVTERLPEAVRIVRSFRADSLVLDGEVVALTPMFFDLLHLDGRDLLDEPLAVRREQLGQLVGEHRVPGLLTADPDQAAAVLTEALTRGHEGVMVKAADSLYQAGRRGRSWRKVKPVYTLDLVVLAVEPGSGRRRGWLSNIHLGARSGDDELIMVGKTFKGMSDELLEWQTRRFEELRIHHHDDRSGYVVWLRPEQVVEIAVDGVYRSSRYPGGVALRFARVLRYRDDKSAGQADTIETVTALGLLRTDRTEQAQGPGSV